MTEPLDERLAAMLEARADRMPANAGREVLAAVREEVRGPRGGAGFEVLPVVLSGRGARVPAGWVAAALAAVLVLAVAGGRLVPSVAAPSTSLPSIAQPSSSAVASTPGPSPDSSALVLPPPAVPAPSSVAAFRDALNAGSLDGRLVLIDGGLVPVAAPCPSPAGPDCFGIALYGLDNVSITWDGPLTSQGAWAMFGQLAFLVRGSTLVFVGRVDGALDAPASVEALLASGPAMPSAFSLFPVSGWLVVDGIHSCPMIQPGGTPCPGPPPWLTDDHPFEDGALASNQGTNGTLLGTPVGRPDGQIVTPGPFLVRTFWLGTRCADGFGLSGVPCSGGAFPQWQIVARYDAASVVRVVTVPPSCDEPLVPPTLTCDQAVAAALAVIPATGAITSIEFHYGWYCPPDAFCPFIPPDGGHGYVVVHEASPGSDLLVEVARDAGGTVTAGPPGPYPGR